MATPSLARQTRLDLVICLGLVVAVLAIYAQVAHFHFTIYDDDLYVSNNLHVQEGLTIDSIRWAMTAVVASNWMPVTMLSHIVDWQLFDDRSGLHHLTSVVLHSLSAMLLFLVLRRATGARMASAFVAAVFALHPLHVESVAWVAERKDVLSALFWFLGLYAYLHYTERPSPRRYLLVVVPFCLGLMSKPMLVTFPCTLLLFDLWPLRRTGWPTLIREKLPLFALSATACAITYHVQGSTGAMMALSLGKRLGNAALSYAGYVAQTFWPVRLAVFYPYAKSVSLWQTAAAVGALLGVSAWVIAARRSRPYLAVGWFWYLGTLVPVIGLVQVGMQSHADRYTYIPMVGLLLMVAWGAVDVVAKWPRAKPAIAVVAVAACVVAATLSWKQAAFWQNSETLFTHAIEMTGDNWPIELQLAYYLMNTPGREGDAASHFDAVVRINPSFANDSNNYGIRLMKQGNCEGAIPHFVVALKVTPNLAAAHTNLGVCQIMGGSFEEAVSSFEAALRSEPDSIDAHYGLGVALAKLPGREPDAVTQFETLLRLKPDHDAGQRNLGVLLMNMGRTGEAIEHLEAAQRLHPDPKLAALIDRLRRQL